MAETPQSNNPERPEDQTAMSGQERFVDGMLRELARDSDKADEPFVRRVMGAVSQEADGTSNAESDRGRLGRQSGSEGERQAAETTSAMEDPVPSHDTQHHTSGHRPSPMRLWLALSAACVMLVLSFFGIRSLIQSTHIQHATGSRGLPTVVSSSEGTQLTRGAETFAATEDFQLVIGDRVAVPANEECVLRGPGRQRLILDGGTEVAVSASAEGDQPWQLDVAKGSVQGLASKDDTPVVLATPHAVMEAVRSNFTIRVAPKGSFFGSKSGLVKLVRTDRQQAIDLKPNEYAVAGREPFSADSVPKQADIRSGFLTGDGVPERRERMKLKQMGLLVAALTWTGAEQILAAETAPKPAAIRSSGISLVPQKPTAEELAQHAKAFYDHLAKIAEAGKVEHPNEPPKGSLARGGKKGKGMPMPATALSRSRRMLSANAASPSKAVGVTTGGMQDIGQARKIISEGKVPTPAMFMPEGLLSEHDIPLAGWPTGESELFASASVAWSQRYGRKDPEAVVQIGFGVDMNLDDFKRPALNMAIVVDVSGSMQGGKIEAARKAVSRLVDQLNDGDRLAIVLFNNTSWTPFPSQVMNKKGRKQAKAVAEKIKSGGGTSIEAGMKFGFEQVAAHLNEPGRSHRVMLFTDAQPNVGATKAEGFMPMTEGATGHEIGLGAFGVGIDFGQDLAYKIFQTRGANYFFLEDEEKIAKVFDKEFDFMVTPAAYDVSIQMVPTKGAEVTDVMGVPDFKIGDEVVSMKIPTLFFSSREGGGATMVAMKLQGLKDNEETPVADVVLHFLPVGKDKKVRQRLEVFLPPGLDPTGKSPFYSQPGAKKALVLANACLALKGACKGQKALKPDEAIWRVVPRKAIKGKRVPAPKPVITLDKKQAKEAVKGLAKFADWFANQGGEFQDLEKELRLIEKLEETLSKHAGLPVREKAREFKDQASAPMAPPLWEDEF